MLDAGHVGWMGQAADNVECREILGRRFQAQTIADEYDAIPRWHGRMPNGERPQPGDEQHENEQPGEIRRSRGGRFGSHEEFAFPTQE